MKRLCVATIVWALLAAAPMAVARTWTSRSGKYTQEAELVDFRNGEVTLSKPDGKLVNVPLVSLCDEDREYVKGQFPGIQEELFQPGSNYRQWASRNGRFTTLAEFLDYNNGTVRLQKVDGGEIFVPIMQLSLDDQRWLREELTRHGSSGQDKGPAEYEEVTGPLGAQTVSMKLLPQEPPESRSGPAARYMLLLTKPQVFYMDIGTHDNPSEADFRRTVSREPTCRAPYALRAVAKLGTAEYAFVLDAGDEKTGGYDRMYFDLNGNGDLTDDKAIQALSVKGSVSAGFVQSQFPRVDVQVEADGVKFDYSFLMSVLRRQSPSESYASASLYAGAVREGYISQGAKKIRLTLIDHNSNGRFDDPAWLERSDAGEILSEGDLLLVNSNPTDCLAADVTMGRDRHFVGRTVCIGKNFYRLQVSPGGRQLTLEPAEPAMGHVVSSSPAYRVLVSSDEYGMLVVDGTDGEQVPLPESRWKVVNYTIDATASKGARTAVTATFSHDLPEVVVGGGGPAKLPFGVPFQLAVTASRASERSVALSLEILGAGGARCTALYIKGRQPPEPRFEVRSPDGKTVCQGKFEYG